MLTDAVIGHRWTILFRKNIIWRNADQYYKLASIVSHYVHTGHLGKLKLNDVYGKR